MNLGRFSSLIVALLEIACQMNPRLGFFPKYPIVVFDGIVEIS